ncbi:MAG: hypothetical protein H6582_13300 [Crocinitomicaceae bacterium]|nr:hypothetical protein [Crocinitomicaceae bacterium]
MKKFLIILSVLFAVVSYGQNEHLQTTYYYHAGVRQQSFWMWGDLSKNFLQNFYQVNPKKGNKYINKYKNIQIDGLSSPISFKVQEGVYGTENSESCSKSYFNSFVSEKYRKERVQRMTENETYGVIIYVSSKNKKVLSNSDYLAIKGYLQDFCK